MAREGTEVPFLVTAAVGLGLLALSRRREGGDQGRSAPAAVERGGHRREGSAAAPLQPGSGAVRGEAQGASGDPRRASSNPDGADRGRQATSPWRIPFAGWKDILWRVYAQVGEDRLLAVAAGVTFYGLLAMFPAISALVSSYALFFDPQTIQGHLSGLQSVMPEGAFGIVNQQIDRLVAQGGGTLSLTFAGSLLFAIWSANNGVKAIIDALNVAYDEEEERGFVRLTLVSLSFTVGAFLAFILSVAAIVVVPIVFSFVGLGPLAKDLISILRWPALMLIVLFGLALLYRYGPDRAPPKFEWVSVGGLFAVVAWLAGSLLLSWYLSNFADYDATYGSLGAAIGLMMWLWMTSIVVLVGAELNAEIEHQTARDTTTGEPQPLGERGAEMADKVAPQAA